VDGDMVSALGNVILLPHSLVTGDVTYATTLDNGNDPGDNLSSNLPAVCRPIPNACGSYTTGPTTWITGAYNYQTTKGDLTVNGNGTATLANGAYCFHNVSVSGGGTLRVNGSVTINVTGPSRPVATVCRTAPTFRRTCKSFSSYTGNNGVSVSGRQRHVFDHLCSGTSVSVSGDSPLFGSLVGKTLTVTGNSMLHYDVLADVFSFFGP